MAGVNFASFTQANSPSLTQFIVGYDTAVSGGERRFALTDIKNLIGGGTVTTVSLVTANGVSGSVANPTTTPAITLTLGAITPTSVSTGALTSSALTSGRVPFATTAGLLTDSSALTFNSGTGVLSATSFSGSGASLTGIVTSLAGTANQITASASTGAVTLSLAGPFNFTSLTNTALLLGAGTSAITPADLTYVSPTLTVPDAFNISSAGSIALTAGGSNKGITGSITGTGNFILQTVGGPTVQAYTYQGLQVVGAINQRTGFMLDAQGTNNPTFMGRRARDTAGAPSAVQLNDTLAQYIARGYGATGYPAAQAGFAIVAAEAFTDSAAGQYTSVASILSGTTTTYEALRGDANGRIIIGSAGNKTRAAWGTFGIISSFSNNAAGGLTITDSTSSGTVATAVANSFAVPTFAASSATTFTNAANLYIAGDIAAGTNVTLTNSYGLWNVGKTKLEGAVQQDVSSAVSVTPYNSIVTLTGSTTAQSIGGGNFDVRNAQTSGSSDVIALGSAARSTGAANMNILYGSRSIYISSSTGNVTEAEAYNARTPITSSSGVITTGYAFKADAQKTANITTAYAFYAAGASDLNYFAGSLRMGNVSTGTLLSDSSGAFSLTGGAGNMTITAGTGASRTLTLQTTTGGGAATTALTLGADQSALFAGVTAFAGAAISATSGAVFPVGTTALSSLRIPHGAAPTSPVNGDMWTTTAGLFVRINGATVGPLS